MADLRYFDALFKEHEAEPAHLLTGPGHPPIAVIVRAFLEARRPG